MNLRAEIGPDRAQTATSETALWRALSQSDDLTAFCTAWIALACGMIAGATGGVVTLAAAPSAPVARWPDGEDGDLAELGGIAAIAALQRKGVVQNADGGEAAEAGRSDRCLLAYPVIIDDRLLGAAAIAVQTRPGTDLRQQTRQLQWSIAWLRERLARDSAAAQLSRSRASGLALDVLASALQAETCPAACRAAATALAHAFDCERVSVGFTKRGRVRVTVISHSAQFGRQMNLVRLIGDAMDEAVDQRCALLHPPAPDEVAVMRAHTALAEAQGGACILTVPMLTHDRFVGAVTFERSAAKAFGAQDLAVLDSVVTALAPVLEEKRRNDRWLPVKIAASIGQQMVRLFGPGHWNRKIALFVIAAALTAGYWWTDVYRITADAVVEGREQRAIGAPFNGYVREAPARAGDQVAEGQILAALDDRDLVLERLRWVTERQRKVLEHERALGERNRAEVQIIATQIEQANAQIALVDEQIARARLTAPFAGLVVSGDLTQAIGATVQRGQVLFEIAPLDSYRVILDVDESQIGDVSEGQTGALVVTALPDQPIPLTVAKITPVAKAHDGRNFFRVEARLKHSAPQLRPGMRGIAKLDVDERRVAWIWTRSFVQWLRLFVWRWTG
ncbi:efflux RND transporter periplasmic adaptor subunit [Pseudorhodoplanes sp.]|uniref:efflux RND transporter periplasmic adaptor subunit n=1 Tax=Pseudorhodoplanes sp. TaxID=1934341 RepID=UPI0039192361